MRFKLRTDPEHDKVYGRRWKAFRLAWLRGNDVDGEHWADAVLRRMFCTVCGAGPLPESAPVDHIREHHGDLQLLFDPANLQRLCTTCHNRRTRLRQPRRMMGEGTETGRFGALQFRQTRRKMGESTANRWSARIWTPRASILHKINSAQFLGCDG